MNRVANFATCLGKYDAVLRGGNSQLLSADTQSVAVGSSDLSGYIFSSTVYTMPDVSNHAGFSFSGWVYPNGIQPYNMAPILDISTNGPYPIALYLSGGSTPSLIGTFNGTSVTTTDICNTIVNRQWNYFCYTVECSGNGLNGTAIQRLHVNGVFNAGVNAQGTYVKQTWLQTYMGMGIGPFANPFKGRIDDMRSYSRILTPMEIQVLYRYPYQKQQQPSYPPPLLETIPTVTMVSATTTIAPTTNVATNALILDASASMFSYVRITRSPAFSGGNATLFVPASEWKEWMDASSSSLYAWSDSNALVQLTSYTYSMIPYVMGTAAPTGINTIVTTPAYGLPTPVTNVTKTASSTTGFTVTWSGGRGLSVTTLFTINGIPVTPSSSSVGTATFTSLSGPTWVLVITPSNVYGNGTSGTITLTRLISPVLHYIFNSANITDGVNIVKFKNQVSGSYNAVIYTPTSTSYTTTSPAITQLLTVFPVNAATGSRGLMLGNVSGLKTYMAASVQTALSSATTQYDVGTGIDNINTTINTSGFTMCLWYCKSFSAQGSVMYYNVDGGNARCDIMCIDGTVYVTTYNTANGTWGYRIGSMPGVVVGNPYGGATPVASDWVHIAVTMTNNGAYNNGTLKMYCNGVLTTTVNNAIYPGTSANGFLSLGSSIGPNYWFGSPPQNCNGVFGIDHVRFYNSVMTESYIQEIYNNNF